MAPPGLDDPGHGQGEDTCHDRRHGQDRGEGLLRRRIGGYFVIGGGPFQLLGRRACRRPPDPDDVAAAPAAGVRGGSGLEGQAAAGASDCHAESIAPGCGTEEAPTVTPTCHTSRTAIADRALVAARGRVVRLLDAAWSEAIDHG